MCIPHGSTNTKSNGFVKEKKPHKSIKKPDENMMKKGDPDFVDERTDEYIPKDKRSILDKFVDFLINKIVG